LVVGAGVAPAFPPAGQLSTPSAPNLPRFACQTTIAAQSIRRKPCGQQIVKPAYLCLQFKNHNRYRLASLRFQLAATRFLRKLTATNSRRVLIDEAEFFEWVEDHQDQMAKLKPGSAGRKRKLPPASSRTTADKEDAR
jgi:hypothetical protein